MKIYIAGHWGSREDLRHQAEAIEVLGHQVTSRWLFRDEPAVLDENAKLEAAQEDLADIQKANWFVMAAGPINSGGKETELGFAIALRYCNVMWGLDRLFIIGENSDESISGPSKTNIFESLCDRSFATWDDFLEAAKLNKLKGN